MDTAYKEHKRDSAVRIKAGLLAWLVIHPAGLKLLLEGLDELELAMAYSGRGLFTALRDDKNHADTMLCKVCIFWDKNPSQKMLYRQLLSIAYAEHASDSTLQRRKIQGRLYIRSGSLPLFSTAESPMSIPALIWSPYLMMYSNPLLPDIIISESF